MKQLITCCLIIFGYSAKSQMSWTASDENLSFLKGEKSIRLLFDLDTFSVEGQPNYKYFLDKSKAALSAEIKTAFEDAFNVEAGKKLEGRSSLYSDGYNYTLKIIPNSYLLVSQPCQQPSGNQDHSYYIIAHYRFEFFNKTDEKPLTVLVLDDFHNIHPKYSECSPRRYNKDTNTEIKINMAQAGTQSAKYILKLIKKSK